MLLRRTAAAAYAMTIVTLLAAGIASGFGSVLLLTEPSRAALAVICIAAAIVLARRPIRIAMVVLVVAATTIAVLTDLPLATVARSIGAWTPITVLIAVVPIVSSVLIRRNYIQLVIAGAARIGPLATQLAVMVSGHVIGSVALLAVVPVLGDFLGLRAQSAEVRRHFSQLILRGFAASVTWSPSTGAMGVIILATGLRWTELAPTLLVVGMTGLLLGAVWTVHAYRRGGPSMQLSAAVIDADMATEPARGRLLELGMFLTVTFGAILTLELLDFATTVVVVPTVMLAGTLGLLVLTEGPEGVVRTVREHLRDRMPRGAGEASFLLTAGFLGSVLAESGISASAVDGILGLAADSGLSIGLLLPPLVMLVTLMGVPPLVAVALVSGSLPLAVTGLTGAVYAALLVIGSAASLLVAPLTPTMLMVADYAGTSPTRTGFADNRAYAPVFLLTLVAVATLLARSA